MGSWNEIFFIQLRLPLVFRINEFKPRNVRHGYSLFD